MNFAHSKLSHQKLTFWISCSTSTLESRQETKVWNPSWKLWSSPGYWPSSCFCSQTSRSFLWWLAHFHRIPNKKVYLWRVERRMKLCSKLSRRKSWHWLETSCWSLQMCPKFGKRSPFPKADSMIEPYSSQKSDYKMLFIAKLLKEAVLDGVWMLFPMFYSLWPRSKS